MNIIFCAVYNKITLSQRRFLTIFQAGFIFILVPEVKSQIEKGIEELKALTCVKFIPRNNEVDYVEFQDGSG